MLEMLCQNTGGELWKQSKNWLINDDYCSWYDANCYEEEMTIASVHLGNNNLQPRYSSYTFCNNCG